MKLLATITDKEVINEQINLNKDYSLRKAARAIVIDNDNKIAILNAINYGFHKLPGGGVEKQENIEKGLRRELIEEIGCEVNILSELGKIIEVKNKYGQKQASYCYVVEVSNKCKTNLTKEEKEDLGIEVKWMSLNRAIGLLEKDNPEDYTAKFIRYRDFIFLREFNKPKPLLKE